MNLKLLQNKKWQKKKSLRKRKTEKDRPQYVMGGRWEQNKSVCGERPGEKELPSWEVAELEPRKWPWE